QVGQFSTGRVGQFCIGTDNEPSQMKFVAALIATSDKVNKQLTAEKNALVSALPQFPLDLGVTDESKWITALNSPL
ncbi:MAG: hypothetical protein ACOH2T_28455, partial [Pseudomonas sp.]